MLNNHHLNEEEIFKFLTEIFKELTFYNQAITKKTLLVNEIGLDSLDFLELFFKIQSKLQDLFDKSHNIEIDGQAIQNQLIEIVLSDTSINLDPQKPELFFTSMKVHHIITLIQQQIQSHVNSNKSLEALKPHLQEILKKDIKITDEQKLQVQKNSPIDKNDDIWKLFNQLNLNDLKKLMLSEYVQTQSIHKYLDEVDINILQTVDMQQGDFHQKLESFLVKSALQEWIQNKKFGYLGYNSRESLNLSIQEAISTYLPSLDLNDFSSTDSKEVNEKFLQYLEKNLSTFIQDKIDTIIKKPNALKDLTTKYLEEQTGSDLINKTDLNSLEVQKHIVSQYILNSLSEHIETINEDFKKEQKVQVIRSIKQEVHSDEQNDFLNRWDQLDDDEE
ncbi:MAG: hypothetical protein COB02_16460 [Candidatus Cloacimonadota bacterium]|nr:MAG: hypothetical protein COB02_16460 [Candidatus Cloacimonadota bacterium]